MAVVLIVAIMAMMTMPLLQEQIAKREIETIARRFIAHAHFARNQALHLGAPVLISPRTKNLWESGWLVRSACIGKPKQADCNSQNWFSQEEIYPIYFKGRGKGFSDPHSNQLGILFNAAGAAKTGQGGFVANRLILGHQKIPHLERQLIMGSGGRWRICDPSTDMKACK
jgi:type IV fimbrial biogenesis protein FimT